jgi:uncharacterized repeat protein (TIGR03803 family)
MTYARLASPLLAIALLAVSTAAASAQTYTVLHAFTGQQDGSVPASGATVDKAGNIYVSMQDGGTAENAGVLDKFDSLGNLTILHAFDCATGCSPQSNPLTLGQGPAANTIYGGASGGADDIGTVFSIHTDGTGYTMLHSFSGKDGYGPTGPVLPVENGLVGVTINGGNGYVPNNDHVLGKGVLFSISRAGQFRKLHDFNPADDGHEPSYVLTDNAGNVYGSTLVGGGAASACSDGCGTIFRFNLGTGQYSILYHFTNGADGSGPILGSIGPDGTLYGTTQTGTGPAKFGTLFALEPSGNGYTLETLGVSNYTNGAFTSGPTLTPDGKLIGVTKVLYAYDAGSRKILYPFSTPADGNSPFGPPTLASDGSIIGTATSGGTTPCVEESGHYDPEGCGVLYRYTNH